MSLIKFLLLGSQWGVVGITWLDSYQPSLICHIFEKASGFAFPKEPKLICLELEEIIIFRNLNFCFVLFCFVLFFFLNFIFHNIWVFLIANETLSIRHVPVLQCTVHIFARHYILFNVRWITTLCLVFFFFFVCFYHTF